MSPKCLFLSPNIHMFETTLLLLQCSHMLQPTGPHVEYMDIRVTPAQCNQSSWIYADIVYIATVSGFTYFHRLGHSEDNLLCSHS